MDKSVTYERLTTAQKRELYGFWHSYNPKNSSSSRIGDGRVCGKLVALGLIEPVSKQDDFGWHNEYIITAGGIKLYEEYFKIEPVKVETKSAYSWHKGSIGWDDPFAAIEQLIHECTGSKDTRFLQETLDSIYMIATTEREKKAG